MIEYVVSESKTLKFNVDSEVFSPSGIDLGTLAMLTQVQFQKEHSVLDLGCGYGFVGIFASEIVAEDNVTMVDISEKAVALAKQNAVINNREKLRILQSDALDNVTQNQFDWILSNPPYHVDFSVPKKFIYQSYEKLAPNGKLVMVTKRKDWYKNKLISVFGGVSVAEIDGYYVFTAQKRSRKQKIKEKNKNNLSKKLERKLAKQKKRTPNS